jgi:UDP-N-acetylmuramate--alanine ligase
MKEQYKNSFKRANKIYWLPSYLAREDPSQTMLAPKDLIGYLNNRSVAKAAEKNNQLWQEITRLADDGYVVILLAGGGGGSLDEWARNMVELKSN